MTRPARSWLLRLALLLIAAAAQAQPVATPFNHTRTSSFAYGSEGLLSAETVEPDIAEQCLSTSYVYDAYGNRAQASTAHCGVPTTTTQIAPRSSTATYATYIVTVAGTSVAVPTGAFLTQASNAATPAHTETRELDPRFGVLTKLTGPNGLTTTWQLDELGRPILELRSDSTQVATSYCYQSGSAVPAVNTSTNSTNCATLGAQLTPPANAVMFDQLALQNAAGVDIASPLRAYYDQAGRKIRVVTLSFAGSAIATDSEFNAFGAVVVSTQPYFLYNSSSRTTGSNDFGLTHTQYDSLGRPIVVHSADASGSVTSFNYGASRTRRSAKTLVRHEGLTVVTTDDLSRTRTEEKNPEGRVVRATDALGAQLVHHHDAFGNLVLTRDALQNNISLAYDIRGCKLVMDDPDAGRTFYCYDALGQLRGQQTSKQRGAHAGTHSCPTVAVSTATLVTGWSTFAYDALGRTLQRALPEYVTSWAWDGCTTGKGRLCAVGSTTSGHAFSRSFSYDSQGRPASSLHTLGGQPLAHAQSYDLATGRIASYTYPSGLKLGYTFNSFGFLASVRLITNVTAGSALGADKVLWEGNTYNAWGRPERHDQLGSGSTRIQNLASYEAFTGRVTLVSAGIAGNEIVNQSVTWNSVQQITQRVDSISSGAGAATDTFSYDALNRLTQYLSTGPGSTRTVTLAYNALGMMLNKSDVGVYQYATQGVVNGLPHAVGNVAGVAYTYDLNGNATTASGAKWRSIAYTSFNLPDATTGAAGAAGTPRRTWRYDENLQRYRETHTDAAGTRDTYSLHPDNARGLGFEVEERGATRNNRHFISAAGQTVAVILSQGNLPTPVGTAPVEQTALTAVKLEFWHRDHLGSTAATSSATGVATARYSYDPFGKRRNLNSSYDAAGALVIDWDANPANVGVDRGLTGHEHLDDLGLVHMNGRVFDPLIARFLQADPFVQDSGNLQSFDRYQYCFNSPVTCTDPSGYIFKWLARHWRDEIWRTQIGRAAVAIAVSALIGPGGGANFLFGVTADGFASAAIAGFAGGAVATGNLKGSLQGAFTASVFVGAGEVIKLNQLGYLSSVAVHAVAGCVVGEASGGTCASGALSASFSKAATVYLPDLGAGMTGGVIKSMIAGGVGSAVGGGKFANGAVTGAFGYLFNEVTHRLSKYGSLSFDQDRALRRYEVQLRNSMALFEGRLSDLYPEEMERFGRWRVSIDMDRSRAGVEAVTTFSSQSAVFYRQFFLGDGTERLDTVAHEFRHLMPQNNALSQGVRDAFVLNPSIEIDARNWACQFTLTGCKK